MEAGVNEVRGLPRSGGRMMQGAKTRLLAVLLLACAPPAMAQVSTSPASPHGSLAVPCADCHSPTGWKPAQISDRFDHGAAGFALEGAHAATSCLSCHTSLDFRGNTPTCAGCHQDVHLGQLGVACADCHTPRGFADRARLYRRHQLGRFPLEGPHAVVECTRCHQPGSQGVMQYASVPTDCAQCHQATFQATRNPDHVAAGFPRNCTTCHTRNTWSGGQFDHGTTAYPLVGAHAAATCQDCHADGTFRGRDQACITCHVTEFDAATDPPHRAAQFPTDCTICHAGPTTWEGATFDHDAGAFPLVGAHRAVTCESCHAGGAWTGRPTACIGCHQPQYDATRSPDHRAAGFSTDCTTCHTQVSWPGAVFDHATTQFTLTGGHVAAPCTACHADGVYRGRSMACFSCHQPDYQATQAPNHQASNLPLECNQCHSTAAWAGAAFDHDVTRFPLTGSHRAITCLDCHADGVYAGRGIECITCHEPDYDATREPDHRAAAMPLDCTICHDTGTWGNLIFNHASTQFPLTGAHVHADCASCHTGGTYQGTTTTCAGCHQADYDATRAPNHQASGLPANCQQCHSTTAWAGGSFDHSGTGFPLTGAHLATTCLECHGDGVYRGKPTACATCHQDTYDATTTPNHQSAGFPTDCLACHTTAQWPGAVFEHDATAFPLTGAHRAITCLDCHADGVYSGKPVACVACHLGTWNATAAPNHQAAGFPTDCLACHNTIQWPGAVFQHDATQFPLTGAHRAVTCQDCHADGVYSGKPVACLTCHQQDYAATTAPPHQSLAFPTDCQVCHTTAAWPGASYDHATTSFPLTGAHVSTPCASCHVGGVYRGTPATCAGCHQQAFDATVNPNHRTAMFPTTCLSCHTTITWLGARFEHDAQYFPIYSGKHREKWATCATCHTNNQNYAVFNCLGCHEHNKTKMDDKHRGRAGYSYTSTACLSCHPRGTEG